MAPDVVAAVVKRYRNQAAEEEKRMAGGMQAAQDRIAQLKGEIGRLVDAIASGEIDVSILKQGLDSRKEQLAAAEAELAEHQALRPIVLHPQIVESYRRRIALLGTALAADDRARKFLPVIRSLIGYVVVSDAPTEPDQAQIEVTGSLANVLALATGKAPAKQSKGTATLVAEERYALRSPLRSFRA